MIILAVDIYGIRPFEQAKRILLKPGLNAIVGGNGSGKSMIYQALTSVLFDAPTRHIAFFEDQTQQAAVTFRVPDGGIHRIARDFKKNIWHLSKKETQGNTFTTIETDRNKILFWVKTLSGGLDERERTLLFMIDPPRLPSRHLQRDGVKNLPLPEIFGATVTSGFTEDITNTPQAEAQSDAEREEKEEALKTAQKKLDDLAEIDDEMFAKRDQAVEIRKRLTDVSEIEDKIKRMKAAETEKFSYFSSENLISAEQIQHFESDEKALAADFDTYEMEGQGLEAALILKKREAEGKNPILIIGLVLITISFLLPFVISLSGPFRYIFLGGVLSGSALSGFAYFKRMKRAAAQNTLEKKLLQLDERVRSREQQFEKKHAAIYAMIKKTASKDLSELKTQQSAYRNLQQKKEAALARIDEMLKGETPEALTEKATNLETEVETLREQLKDHQTLSEEVYRLQEVLRDSEPVATPDTTFSGLPGIDSSLQAGETSFFSGLLEIGKNGTRPSRERLEHDAGILYRRFRPHNNEAIQVAANGEIKVGQTPLHHLSPGLADQVFLSLSLSSLSQFSNIAFPIFLDEPFESLDPSSCAAAIKILQVIAKRRQVVFFTTHSEFAQKEQIVLLGDRPSAITKASV